MKSDSSLQACKELYAEDTHPFDLTKLNSEPYIRLLQLGKELIEELGLQDFLGYLLESQYRVNFWAAKLALEYEHLTTNEILVISGRDTIVDHCIEVVERHISFQTTDVQETNGKAWMEGIKSRFGKM